MAAASCVHRHAQPCSTGDLSMTFSKFLSRSLFSLAATVLGHQAQAECAEWQTLSVEQARQHMSELVAPEGDPLEQLFAFGALMCSDQPVVRQIALKNAANAPSETIRSQLLLTTLMNMTVLRIELGEGKPVDPEGEIAPTPPTVWLLGVKFRDPPNACLSLFQTHGATGCHDRSLVEVSGLRVTMVHWTKDLAFDGKFLYEYGNTLTGEIRKAGLRIPATITLF